MFPRPALYASASTFVAGAFSLWVSSNAATFMGVFRKENAAAQLFRGKYGKYGGNMEIWGNLGTSMIGKSQGKTEISLDEAEADLPASGGLE